MDLKHYAEAFKALLIAIFLLLGLVSFGYFCYLVFVTMFGVGWGGGDTTNLEIIWMWSGLLIFSIYAIVAGIGIARRRNYGWTFGLSIPITFAFYTLLEILWYIMNGSYSFTIPDFLWSATIYLILALIFYGIIILKSADSDVVNYPLVFILGIIPALLWFINLY